MDALDDCFENENEDETVDAGKPQDHSNNAANNVEEPRTSSSSRICVQIVLLASYLASNVLLATII